MGKRKDFLIFFAVLLFFLTFPNHGLRPSLRSRLIVWNVGQGQWVTYSDALICLHFDMGGEFASFGKIYKECRRKKNVLFLSHGDWDHIRFARKAKQILFSLCLEKGPRESLGKKKKRFLKNLPPCSLEERVLFQAFVHELSFPFKRGGEERVNGRRRRPFTANDLSRVFVLRRKVFLPGDSTIRLEKVFSRQMFDFQKTLKWALASHHGSRFSNSDELLAVLSALQMVLVSARKKRYGHPHSLVLEKWKNRGLSVLRTELWGNIYLQM